MSRYVLITKLIIRYVGSNGEEKNWEYAIEAIRAFTKALQLATGKNY